MSHYQYLNKHLDDFWMNVFGRSLKDSWCAGIVSAHGDKFYGYRAYWSDHGIHFYHGAMLALLSYTDLLDRPKHETKEWVVEIYPKYKDLLPPIDDV